MASKQTQTVIEAGMVILATACIAIALKTIALEHKKNAWEVTPADVHWINDAPPQVVVRRTKFPKAMGSCYGQDDQNIGVAMDARRLILLAYQVNGEHVEFATKLPDGKYDFIANLPTGSGKALQQEIKNELGLTGHFEPRTKDALVLRVKGTSSLRLTQRKSYDTAGMYFENNAFRWSGQPTYQLANWLEEFFEQPLVDDTGLTNLDNYNFDLDCTRQDLRDHNFEKIKQALEKIGFELTPTNQAIDTLIIQKAH